MVWFIAVSEKLTIFLFQQSSRINIDNTITEFLIIYGFAN